MRVSIASTLPLHMWGSWWATARCRTAWKLWKVHPVSVAQVVWRKLHPRRTGLQVGAPAQLRDTITQVTWKRLHPVVLNGLVCRKLPIHMEISHMAEAYHAPYKGQRGPSHVEKTAPHPRWNGLQVGARATEGQHDPSHDEKAASRPKWSGLQEAAHPHGSLLHGGGVQPLAGRVPRTARGQAVQAWVQDRALQPGGPGDQREQESLIYVGADVASPRDRGVAQRPGSGRQRLGFRVLEFRV